MVRNHYVIVSGSDSQQDFTGQSNRVDEAAAMVNMSPHQVQPPRRSDKEDLCRLTKPLCGRRQKRLEWRKSPFPRLAVNFCRPLPPLVRFNPIEPFFDLSHPTPPSISQIIRDS
jgi:hypothetical protein